MTQKTILYGHAGCPSVPLVRTILEQAEVEFHYIDIRSDETGRTQVRAINHGYESVPTLVFPDGTTLTEPTSKTLKDKLSAMGYDPQPPKWVEAFENLIHRIAAQRK